MKKIIGVILLICMTTSSAFASILPVEDIIKQDQDFLMVIDEKPVDIGYSAIKGYSFKPVYFPIRYLKHFGVTIEVDAATKEIKMTKGKAWLNFKVGDKKILTHYGEVTLDAVPIQRNGITFLPFVESVTRVFGLAAYRDYLFYEMDAATVKKYNLKSSYVGFHGLRMRPISYRLGYFTEYRSKTSGHSSLFYDMKDVPLESIIYLDQNLYVAKESLNRVFNNLYNQRLEASDEIILTLKKGNEEHIFQFDLNAATAKTRKNNLLVKESYLKKIQNEKGTYVCLNDILGHMDVVWASSKNTRFSNEGHSHTFVIYPMDWQSFEIDVDLSKYSGKSMFVDDGIGLDIKFLVDLYSKFVPRQEEAYASEYGVGIGYKHFRENFEGRNMIYALWFAAEGEDPGIIIHNLNIDNGYQELIYTLIDLTVTSPGDRKYIKEQTVAYLTYYKENNQVKLKTIEGIWKKAPNGSRFLLEKGALEKPTLYLIRK